jgi:hypothetical protein
VGHSKSAMKPLKPDEINLLVEVLRKRLPSVLSSSDQINVERIRTAEMEEVCQALTDEFCETGLLPSSEPNKRGLLLEQLIDRIRST